MRREICVDGADVRRQKSGVRSQKSSNVSCQPSAVICQLWNQLRSIHHSL